MEICRFAYSGTEETRGSRGIPLPDKTGELGDIGETGDSLPLVSLFTGFCGDDEDRFDFEEPGRVVFGKAEYEARFRPSLVFFTMTVPVEFEDESDASESFETGWWGASIGFAILYDSAPSSPGEMLGSSTMSSDTRLIVLSMRSSFAGKLVLLSDPCTVPCGGV